MTGTGPGGTVRIIGTDMAVLEAREKRQDLPCAVTETKPFLGFDLRFHAGYEVSVPLRELAGGENLLTILFRVSRPDQPDEPPVYFIQRVRVPAIEDGARGDAFLQGGFDLGEGKYRVDWLMRDRSERVCSAYWDLDAALASRDREMGLQIEAGRVQASSSEQFQEEPPVERAAGDPLNVKMLVNFAPQNAHAATLQPIDTSALVSILRTISRDPRIGKFSLTAFNLQEQRVVFRQAGADRIDFPALGEALDTLNLGTVDLKRLSEKHGETAFLTELIRQEALSEREIDALIFAGPKALLSANPQQDALREIGGIDFPVFYMNYNLSPQTTPWRDAIGHAVRFFRGQEFTITRPRDLWYAVSDMVSRIVKSKHERRNSAASTQ